MKTILLSFLFFFTWSAFAQSGLGIGLVSIKFDDKTVLIFYANPTNTEPARKIEFYNDSAINSWSIRNLNSQRQWLKPEALNLDYSSFVFRCKSKTSDFLEVVVNNETGETLWLKKSVTSLYLTWETYLKGMFGVARLGNPRQTIRTRPDDQSEEIKYSGHDCFQVKSMKGNWIEIFTPPHCDDLDGIGKPQIKSGWIRWKHGNKLLIEYYFTS